MNIDLSCVRQDENRKRSLHHSQKQEISQVKSSYTAIARERYDEAERLFGERLVFEKELARHVHMEQQAMAPSHRIPQQFCRH
eukprot:3518853-Amphidinium_carterae.1